MEAFILHMALSLVRMAVKNPSLKKKLSAQMFEVWDAIGTAYADDPNFKQV